MRLRRSARRTPATLDIPWTDIERYKPLDGNAQAHVPLSRVWSHKSLAEAIETAASADERCVLRASDSAIRSPKAPYLERSQRPREISAHAPARRYSDRAPTTLASQSTIVDIRPSSQSTDEYASNSMALMNVECGMRNAECFACSLHLSVSPSL